MTKDERYKALNVLYELKHNLLSERSKKQIDVVMKILCHEEEPCPYWDYGLNTCRHANIGALATKPPCKDAISREDLLDAISNLNYWHANQYGELRPGGAGDYATVYKANDVERMADTLPSVTPIRPKGEWEYDKTIQNWRCSKCHETPKTLGYVGTKEFMTEHFKFCNHCGADMRGKIVGAESEDKE